jgi:hypothetical protein
LLARPDTAARYRRFQSAAKSCINSSCGQAFPRSTRRRRQYSYRTGKALRELSELPPRRVVWLRSRLRPESGGSRNLLPASGVRHPLLDTAFPCSGDGDGGRGVGVRFPKAELNTPSTIRVLPACMALSPPHATQFPRFRVEDAPRKTRQTQPRLSLPRQQAMGAILALRLNF